MTEDDLAFLNSRVITSLTAPELDIATIVVKLNSLRLQVNWIRLEHFARSQGL